MTPMQTPIWQRPDFLRRLAVTAAAVLVYRLGTHIPMPGLNVEALALQTHSLGVSFGSGSAIQRVSINLLGINPILTVLMYCEALKLVFTGIGAWEMTSLANWHRLQHFLLVCVLAVSLLQGYGIALAFERLENGNSGLLSDGSVQSRIAIIVTTTALSALNWWLMGVITREGAGNGLWVLYASLIAISWPGNVASAFELINHGAISLHQWLVPLMIALLGLAALFAIIRAAGTQGVAIVGPWPAILGASLAQWLVFLPMAMYGNFNTMTDSANLVKAVLTFLLVAWFAWIKSWRDSVPSLVGSSGVGLVSISAVLQGVLCAASASVVNLLGTPFYVSGVSLIVLATLAASFTGGGERDLASKHG